MLRLMQNTADFQRVLRRDFAAFLQRFYAMKMLFLMPISASVFRAELAEWTRLKMLERCMGAK
jgi:hypothetical protein